MIDEQKYKEIKQRVEKATRERDVATGQLAAITEQLQREFDCKDVAAAKKLLVRLNTEAEEAEEAFEEAVKTFEEKWDERTGQTSKD